MNICIKIFILNNNYETFSIFYYQKANAFNTNEMHNTAVHIHIQMQQTAFNNTELLTTTKKTVVIVRNTSVSLFLRPKEVTWI